MSSAPATARLSDEVPAIIEAAPAAIEQVSIAKTAALVAWENYRIKAEPLGLAFGQRLYELRKDISAQGRDGEGLCAWLDKVKIPRSTAYYWIQRYEISIGEREPKEEKQTKNADVVQAEHVTTRDEMPYRIEPSAPNSEVTASQKPRPWSPDREKRKNRSTPVKDFEELRTLAVKMLIAGYEELKETGEYDNSHLYAAREWAQLSIADAEVVQ